MVCYSFRICRGALGIWFLLERYRSLSLMRIGRAILLVLVLACGLRIEADGSDHRYKEGDRVPLYANKVGPFHNPR